MVTFHIIDSWAVECFPLGFLKWESRKLSYNFMMLRLIKKTIFWICVLQFIFSTAIDGKIKAWLYDCLGSRVDYDAPGLWCTTMAYSADGTRLVQKPVHFDLCLVSDLICFKVRKLWRFLCNECDLTFLSSKDLVLVMQFLVMRFIYPPLYQAKVV